MLIQQHIAIPQGADRAWPFFNDIPSVADCVPGADAVEPSGPDSYRGRMTVRVGPLALSMVGSLSVIERDDAQRRLVLRVKAEDRRLGSAAESIVTLHLEEADPATSRLCVDADTTVRGKLAQFGQGMIKLAADDVLKRFAVNVSRRLTDQGSGA
ncbi:MAG: hypothetical protein NVSMB2_13400 [Chloroflexota bacterium]